MATGVVDPLIGQLVDERYQVTVRIARGGMATVYRALDRRLDREVALKVMHPHLAEGADFVARFRREARSAARLVHPGVVSVFDQGTAGDSPYLVMEFIDGPNLRAHLRAAGSLPLGEALSITAQVLDALALAHKQGVVHRDIKPENILLAPGGRIKVADFGLARAISEVTMVTTGVVMGTVAYLSPEVVQQGAADARSDVYACGILLYELLTGTQPFRGENAMQVAYQHVHGEVPPPSATVEWLPREVDDLVQTMTHRDPNLRPADAGAALDMVRRTQRVIDPSLLQERSNTTKALDPADLPDLSDLSSPAAHDDFFADVESLFDDPDRTEVISGEEVAAIATGGSTIALPVGVGQGLLDGVAPLPQDDDEQPAKHAGRLRNRMWLWVTLAAVVLGLACVAGWYFLAGPGARVTVPGIVGLSEQTAVDKLTEIELGSSVSRSYSDTVQEGVVISSDPAPGERVAKKGTVALVISRGIKTITVPKVAGLTESEAVSELKAAGLQVGKPVHKFSTKVPLGFVIGSTPKVDQTIPHNEAVALIVSKGPEPVQMPDIVGKGANDANAALDKLSLTPTVAKENSRDVPAGVVISQSPKAGVGLHRGDSVAYTVSEGPRMIDVPDMMGQELANARAELERLGFVVKVVKPQKLAPLERVYEQSPAAGSQAPEGSTITLSIF